MNAEEFFEALAALPRAGAGARAAGPIEAATAIAGGRRREGKITQLTEIDLAEISTVPVPANEGVRTLSIKAMRPIELVSFEVA